MTHTAIRHGAARLQRGSVSAILGLLQGVHDQVSEDEIMDEVAATVGQAIRQMRDLQQLAYETMLEIETERANRAYGPPAGQRKPH
jgi:GAF domain-containing protein